MAPHTPDARRRIARLRLRAQRLVGPPAGSPVDAVRWMLGLQAQDYPGVRWSVALRTAGATEADIPAALDAGQIVRSWPLRGTLHLVAADDLGWLLALTAERATASATQRRAALGISEAEIERARELAVDALPGRAALPRAALLAAIEAGGVSTAGQRGYHLLWYLAQTGTLVLGPTAGAARGEDAAANAEDAASNAEDAAASSDDGAAMRRGPDRRTTPQTFARLDAWIPEPRRLAHDEALGELSARYFASHGPADASDLARWAGLTITEVRRGIQVAGERIADVRIEGHAYHASPESLDTDPPPAGPLLLPGFDEYILGYRDRSAMLAPEHADIIVPGGNGMFRATVVLDGEVVGTWSRRTGARHVAIDVDPFAPLPPDALGALTEQAERYGAFLDRPVRSVSGLAR